MTGRSREKVKAEEEKAQAEAAEGTGCEEAPAKDELAEARELADQYLNAAKRIQADFDNYRKRSLRDTEEFRKHAADGLATDLLATLDDLDRALDSTGEDNEFIRGVRKVRQNLMKTLAGYGIGEVPTDGMFDPKFHEALCTVEGEEDGRIAEVFQKGYASGDRVLRYSKVKVTKAPEKSGSNEAVDPAEEKEE
ncbi:MAG: nucleotide exchange factor GrpE [Candidatus Methanomethylophilaceae archaeon]|nr:nucleotide exchange factor GrpE [Candidatus Methanomethylophilaceae archaeon]